MMVLTFQEPCKLDTGAITVLRTHDLDTYR